MPAPPEAIFLETLLAGVDRSWRESGSVLLVVRFDPEAGGLREADVPLTAAERRRYARLVMPSDRRRFLISRLAFKMLVERISGEAACKLELVVDTCHGRPVLRGTEGLDINISHSGGWVAIGCSSTGIVGVDVEEQTTGMSSIAKLMLTRSERDYYEQSESTGKDTVLLRTWTVKESVAKYFGSGLPSMLSRIDCTWNGDHLAALSVDGRVSPDVVLTEISEHVWLAVSLSPGSKHPRPVCVDLRC
ncbi:4'-phosphopantetheinyl transferase superfamily protein [Agrobacterium tumefaciens]|nr:4'-phosphopantetheinyl transferase superfamily protein [Agrobacterium tumefaciens]NTE84603.1 4'-phosphopantetheinyl transferase superfamily protein [Agrobacterium tumefaciens]